MSCANVEFVHCRCQGSVSGHRPMCRGAHSLLTDFSGMPVAAAHCGLDRLGQGLGLQQFVQGAWKPFIASDLNGSALQVSALLFRPRERLLGRHNRPGYIPCLRRRCRSISQRGRSVQQLGQWFLRGLVPLTLAILGATLAMIGPGAWSIDARLFGRKHIET